LKPVPVNLLERVFLYIHLYIGVRAVVASIHPTSHPRHAGRGLHRILLRIRQLPEEIQPASLLCLIHGNRMVDPCNQHQHPAKSTKDLGFADTAMYGTTTKV